MRISRASALLVIFHLQAIPLMIFPFRILNPHGGKWPPGALTFEDHPGVNPRLQTRRQIVPERGA